MTTARVPGWRKTIAETLICGVLIVTLVFLFHPLAVIDNYITARVMTVPRSVQPIIQDITLMGEVVTLIVVAVAWSLFELIRKRRDRALAMLASLVSLPLFWVFKETIRRNRPVLSVATKAGFHGYSFPSGHATGSAAVYGVLSFMVARELPSPWNRIVSGLTIVLVILIGISRVYLRAHFPSDVLGGWLLGLAWYNIVANQQRQHPREVVLASDEVD